MAVWQFIYKDSHKRTFMHIHAFTHARESVWVALVEVPQLPRPPDGVRRSGTLPTICKAESRHVQQVPPAAIFVKLLIAGFGFHQAWQWEPQPPINLDPYLQRCRPFRNPRSPTLPPVDFAPIQAHCSINRMPYSLTGVTDFSVLICRISKTRENAERNALLCV